MKYIIHLQPITVKELIPAALEVAAYGMLGGAAIIAIIYFATRP